MIVAPGARPRSAASAVAVRRQLPHRDVGRRQHRHRPVVDAGARLVRAHPGDLVGLPADVAGALAGRHHGQEEAGVVATWLELRRDPVRPGTRAGRCAARGHVGRGSRRTPGSDRPVRRGRAPSRLRSCRPRSSPASRPPAARPTPRRSRASAAHTSARASRSSHWSTLGPLRCRRPRPGDRGVEVARVDRPSGEREHPCREGHPEVAAQQVDLGTVVASRSSTTVDAPFGVTGVRSPTRKERACSTSSGGSRRVASPGEVQRTQETSTTISTSTGASSGRTGTPTADRACWPASPNTWPISSLAPLATPG